MRTRAVRDGDEWVLTGTEGVDHQRRRLGVLHRARRHRPRRPARQGHQRLRRREGRPGLRPSAPRSASSASRAPPPASCCSTASASPATGSSASPAPACSSRCAPSTTPASPSAPRPSASPRARSTSASDYVKQRQQFGKRIADFQGIQFMLADMAMKLEAARQMVYVAAAKSERDDPDLPFFGAAAKCFASDTAMAITVDAVQLLGGCRLHPGLRRRADDARRQDHPDLRGHQPGPARRHGPPADRPLTRPPESVGELDAHRGDPVEQRLE